MEALRSLVSRLVGGRADNSNAPPAAPEPAGDELADEAAADGAIDMGEPSDDSEAIALAFDQRRLAIAQHWARAALSYESADAWQPIVIACALAALVTRDLDELAAVLRETVGRVGADPRTANVWRAAVQELEETRANVGAALEQPNDWTWSLLAAKLRRFLDSAQAEAERLRTPSLLPPAENS